MKKSCFLALLLVVVFAMTSTAFATTSIGRSASQSVYVGVGITDLQEGEIFYETKLAGTWKLYATAVYGGENNAYPISVGSTSLSFSRNATISGGSGYNGAPTESTSSSTDGQGNKSSITLKYSCSVYVLYANRAARKNPESLESEYLYGPTDNATRNVELNMTITCTKK